MTHWFLSQWFWLSLTLAIGVAEWTLYVLIPAQARRLAKRGAYDQAIRLLERVASLPAMAGDGVKIGVRHQLGILYRQHKRFTESAGQFQTLLRDKIPAGVEADTRRRLADSLDSLGQFTQAATERGKAQEAVQGKGDMLALLSRSDLLKRENRYQEAFGIFEQALAEMSGHAPHMRAEVMVKIPFHQQRRQATLSLGCARMLAHDDQAQTAWSQLQEAITGFAHDEKLTLWCEAAGAWILALLDRSDQAQQRMRYVQEHCGKFFEDKSGHRSCVAALAMTTFSLRDYAASKLLWTEYRALGPDPAWLPRGYYRLGECCRCLDEEDEARQAYTQAVAPGSDTYDARCARQRLTESVS